MEIVQIMYNVSVLLAPLIVAFFEGINSTFVWGDNPKWGPPRLPLENL